MKQWRRLIFYLILNVLVSASTTFAVLVIWDRTHSPVPGNLIPLPQISLPISKGPTPTGAVKDTPQPQPTPTEVFIAYQVVSGDDFASIARKFGVSEAELIAVNGFTQAQPLGAGEVLRIPVHAPTPEAGNIRVDSVAGVGDLASERVLIRHTGDSELSLTGWTISDEDGHQFIFPEFPQLTLFKGGAVTVFSRAGNNSVVDLYWGMQQPVWRSGETLTVKDAAGVERATYQVP